MAWSMPISVGVTFQPNSGWPKEEIRCVQVSITSKCIEGKDEVISEASAFQREEVELVRPFLIWHMTEASH